MHHRDEIYKDMKTTSLDILVIGGGITGAGILLDTVSRGLKGALIDMQDFGAGTSSRSTKLVHGGLRYLKQLEIKMVSEVGKERAIVYENAPHVTRPEWMLLPIYKGGTFGKFSTNLGLWFYDYLAGVKKEERRKMLTIEETLTKEPLLKKEWLKGSGYYVEYKTDDARLTLEVIKKAVALGGNALNYAKVIELLYEEGRVVGIVVEDQLNGEMHRIYANKIINATGPWVDQIREFDKSKGGKTLHLTKGVHLVFSQKRFPLNQAIYFDTPDGRMVFAIPRSGKTYVGTTDTSYDASIKDPRMTKDDLNYLIKAVNYMFPSIELTENDVESSWVGLRPLIHEDGKSPSQISRKDEIFNSDSGLISMAGGKLTGYRKMAENVVDLISKDLGHNIDKSRTKYMTLSGGEVGGSKGFEIFLEDKINQGISYGLSHQQSKELVYRYGSNVDNVLSEYRKFQTLKEGIDPFIFAMLRYGIDNEMICTPSDFFIRRSSALFFNIDFVNKHKDSVISFMSDEFQWTIEEKEKHNEELLRDIYYTKQPVE
ncbi:glycerol-3-phosphate dehydrogenase/oxidase [Tenuibacillus multivorans]|nr:glycerol-3-phosphate dehydrogenase/oxidase [Tenuibacillus multivorans]